MRRLPTEEERRTLRQKPQYYIQCLEQRESTLRAQLEDEKKAKRNTPPKPRVQIVGEKERELLPVQRGRRVGSEIVNQR